MTEDARFGEDAPGEEPDAPAAAEASRSLTLRPRALAGNPACLNCGTPLQGPYCHYCGQPDRNFLRFFPALLRDLLEDFLDLDSRFMRTMKPLLFKPGRLTRDFLEGRRFRYTPPLRLYLFSSLIFFLMAATMSTDTIRIQTQDRGEDTGMVIGWKDDEVSAGTVSEATLADLDEATRAEVEDALARAEQAHRRADAATTPSPAEPAEDAERDAPPETSRSAEQPPAAPETAGTRTGRRSAGNSTGFTDMIVGGKPWDRETNPVKLPFLPQAINDWINDEIAESPRKADQISKNPNLIIDKVFDVAPVTMFVLLPVAALLYKFWYLFARRYYVEHLIFALHNHAFVFVALIITLLLNLGEDTSREAWPSWITATLHWVQVALWTWVPIYFFFAMKHVYRQGWFLTLFKYAAVGASYSVMMIATTTAIALIGFVLL